LGTEDSMLYIILFYMEGQKVNLYCFSTNCAKTCASTAVFFRFECETCGTVQRYDVLGYFYICLWLNILYMLSLIFDVSLKHW